MAFWVFLVKIMQHLWHRFRPHFQPQTTGEQEFLRLLFYFPSNKTALEHEQYQAVSNCSSCINASWPSSFHRIISWRPDRKSLKVRTVNSIAWHCSYHWNCSRLLPLHYTVYTAYAVYAVYTVNTVKTIQTAFHYFNSSMYACKYCQGGK